MKNDIYFWSYAAELFLEWGMFQTKVVKNIKTHLSFNNVFSENSAVCEITLKNIVQTDGQQWLQNTAHAFFMLDTKGYRHTQNA
jgi:hypothetical protein